MYELADALGWEQSRLSHQLRRMRDRGLVVRHGSDDDRRGATVDLTEAGRAALELAAPGHAELVRSVVFDGMPAARLRAFGVVVDTVLERLGGDYQSDSSNLMTPRMFLPSSMSW